MLRRFFRWLQQKWWNLTACWSMADDEYDEEQQGEF